jgi:hypothetical protein
MSFCGAPASAHRLFVFSPKLQSINSFSVTKPPFIDHGLHNFICILVWILLVVPWQLLWQGSVEYLIEFEISIISLNKT